MITHPWSRKMFIYTYNKGQIRSLKLDKKKETYSFSLHLQPHTTVVLLLAEIVDEAREITTIWDRTRRSEEV